MEEKIESTAKAMLEAVKSEEPQMAVAILQAAFLSVTRSLGKALGYQPLVLEREVVSAMLSQVTGNK